MSEPTGGSWPFEPGETSGPGDQMIRINIPVAVPTSVEPIMLRMAITEREARAIANTGPEINDLMGSLFVTLKDGLSEFLRQEG